MNKRTYIERTVPYPSTALPAGCRPPGPTIPLCERARRTALPHAQRRLARSVVASAPGRALSSTLATRPPTPLPSISVAVVLLTKRAVTLRELLIPLSPRERESGNEMVDRRQPRESAVPCAIPQRTRLEAIGTKALKAGGGATWRACEQ